MSITTSEVSSTVYSLPELTSTRSNFSFCPSSDNWIIPDASRHMYFNFGRLTERCSETFIHSFKKVLLWYLKERSTPHANNMFMQFTYLLNSIPGTSKISIITAAHVKNYKASLPQNRAWYLTSLAGFLKKWNQMGYPGVDPLISPFLDGFSLKGNKKGVAVLTFDPEEGPFDEIELQAIHSAVNKAYAAGGIGNREFSLVWLFMALGARPVQIAALKTKDFVVTSIGNGNRTYVVNVPRVKQRNTRLRTLFKQRYLVPEIGDVLAAWIAQVKHEHATAILDQVASDDLPIFPSWNKKAPPGFEHHSDGDELAREICRTFSLLKITSHRTGHEMNVFPRRFRYTVGTRTAMEKGGPLLIAEMLDQSDTQNVGHYVKCVPEIIENLDKALALDLAPFADAFAGKIVPNDFTDNNSKYPKQLLRYPQLHPTKAVVGRCGSGCGDCGAKVPVACYVCARFQAWTDAPHEEVLQDLVDERQRILEETGDERIAFATDHVILAVAQVIQKCRDFQEGKNG